MRVASAILFGKARAHLRTRLWKRGCACSLVNYQKTQFRDLLMLHRALALSFAALALVLFLGQSSLAAEKTHEGTVVKAGNGSLTMKDSQGKQHSHTIPATAAITLDGKE